MLIISHIENRSLPRYENFYRKRDINIPMNRPPHDLSFPRKKSSVFILILSFLEGVAVFVHLISIPSESESAFLLGFSKSRLLLIVSCIFLSIFYVFLLIRFLRKGFLLPDRRNNIWLYRILISIFWVIFWVIFFFLLLSVLPVQKSDSTVSSIAFRIWDVLLWGALLSVQMIFLIQFQTGHWHEIFNNYIKAFFFALFLIVFYLFISYYDQIDWIRKFKYSEITILTPAAIALIWVILSGKIKDRTHAEKLDTIFLCLLIGSVTYTIYRVTGYFMNRVDTPSKAYWHLLADAFNHGHLNLIAPPTTHDLTLYQGKWYVPNPPLPAILLMPVVALLGVEGVNMTIVSALLGALNAVIVYLVLQCASGSGMTACKRSTNLWLTAVFALSSNHIWLATTGQMWFISQLVTILFIGLGTIAVIQGKPAWVSGLMIGMAVLARPNIFPIAIFLMGIYLWKAKPFPEVEWGKAVRWAIGFGIPVLICGFLELLYNYLRFEDWFDFGYVTINGASWIMEAVQKYGMFHPHFLRENFEVMFLRMPRIDTTGERFFFQPGYAGYSIFAMTPAFIYLVRGIKKNWWVIGAWVSVILTVGLLLLYHNTGAEQVGYRYIQDAIIPLVLLLGVGVGEKPGILFKGLTMLGVVINLLSTYWWYIGRA